MQPQTTSDDAMRGPSPAVGLRPGAVAGQPGTDDGTFDPRRLRLAEERRDGNLRPHVSRSQTERAVLRVLAAHRGTYLRRGQVHRQLDIADPPTLARVGQILRKLVAESLLQSVNGRARGNPNSAFYTLSPLGLAVFHDLVVAAAGADEKAERLRGAVPAIDALRHGRVFPLPSRLRGRVAFNVYAAAA
jgi:hypothetical protein